MLSNIYKNDGILKKKWWQKSYNLSPNILTPTVKQKENANTKHVVFILIQSGGSKEIHVNFLLPTNKILVTVKAHVHYINTMM